MRHSLALNRTIRVAVKPPRDPGFGALRRSARAAIVIPLLFAFTDVLLREPQILIVVIFGCFSLLVISDFGGMRRPRAIAYLTSTVVGAALVAAANTGLLLSFVVAVSIPAAEDATPMRIGGWAVAGLVSTLAAVALWPRFERITMDRDTSKALNAMGITTAMLPWQASGCRTSRACKVTSKIL